MTGRRWARIAAAAAMVGVATLAFTARPALAAGPEGDSDTWAYAQGGPMSCQLGVSWTCATSAPIEATGVLCVQSTHVDVNGGSVTVARTGCTAQLSIDGSGWQGIYNCNRGYPVAAGCQGALAAGQASFSFQPVLGEALNAVPATITDAACDQAGGHATLTATVIDPSSDNVFQMDSTLNWVGSCRSVAELTWTGTLTVG